MKSNIKIHGVIIFNKHQLSGLSPTFTYFSKTSVAIFWSSLVFSFILFLLLSFILFSLTLLYSHTMKKCDIKYSRTGSFKKYNLLKRKIFKKLNDFNRHIGPREIQDFRRFIKTFCAENKTTLTKIRKYLKYVKLRITFLVTVDQTKAMNFYFWLLPFPLNLAYSASE